MAIGSSLGITLPSQGGNTGTWGTDLNTELDKIITAVEANVPVTAIDFSADFDIGDTVIESAKAVEFDVQSSDPSNTNAIFVDSAGEFNFTDNAGNTVQMTASGALNLAATGGLGDSGGDYGTGGITFDWDGTGHYNARYGSGTNQFSPVRMSLLKLRDGSSNELTVDVPSMSTNYTLSLPAAVPSTAGTLMQSDTSGNITFSNTGLDDITLAANQHVTVSGTGKFKHGSKDRTIPMARGLSLDNAYYNTAAGTWDSKNSGGTEFLHFDLGLAEGERLVALTVHGISGDAAGEVMEGILYSKSGTSALAQVSTTKTSGTATGADSISWSSSATGIEYTVPANTSLILQLDLPQTSGAGEVTYDSIEMTYDQP